MATWEGRVDNAGGSSGHGETGPSKGASATPVDVGYWLLMQSFGGVTAYGSKLWVCVFSFGCGVGQKHAKIFSAYLNYVFVKVNQTKGGGK